MKVINQYVVNVFINVLIVKIINNAQNVNLKKIFIIEIHKMLKIIVLV